MVNNPSGTATAMAIGRIAIGAAAVGWTVLAAASERSAGKGSA